MKIAHISLSDWSNAVDGMTLEEEGFFWRMTRLMYANEAPFPDQDRENADVMRIDLRVYRRLKSRLMTRVGPRKPVIKVVDGQLVNKRVLAEIEKFCDAKKKASERGKAGNAARWGKHKDRPDFGRTSGELPAEVGRKLEPDSKKINDLGIATPYSILHTPKEKKIPPSPLGGDETRGESFSARRAEREARAAREVAQAAPKQEVNPYRAKNHNFASDADPKHVGAAFSEDGTLQLFNGARAEGLALSGSEEQLRIDLLVVQSSPRVGPSLNPVMLKSRVLGVLADITDKRKQADRRYAEACARKAVRDGGAGRMVKSDGVMETWEPTQDEAILRERFAWYVTKTKAGHQLLTTAGQEAAWRSFRKQQLARATEPA